MIDWQSVQTEAAAILSRYLQIDTTNPPGNERLTAYFLAELMVKRGFEPKLFEPAEGRANLVARVKSSGANGGPILLLHHMDVVSADASAWSVDPFGGEIRDGYLYGRGAIDMKNLGIMQLIALDLLRKQGKPLQRDVIFMAVADEEMGGQVGTGWMVDHYWDLIAPEVVWDEGGFGLKGLLGDRPVFYTAVAEKRDIWARLVATGEPGLASVPRGNNPVDLLTQALERIRQNPFPPRLTPVTTAMFKQLAGAMSFPHSFLLKHVEHPLVWRLVNGTLTEEPEINAMLRNLVTPTMLRASDKQNVISQTAEAGLDIRLLPDQDVEAFLAELNQIIADDRIRLEVPENLEKRAVSPFEGGFFEVLSTVLKRRVPEGITVPMQTPGGTDSAFFRQKGVPAYGLMPIVIDQGELNRMHGIDERISLDNLLLGTQVAYEVLCEMCL